jgi:mRNA-degrading endonuclease YafQ of YafQ-DinJ toxin-antitoxin module
MKAARRGDLVTVGKPSSLLTRLHRIVKYTNRFKRDYRRERSGRHGKKLDNLLTEVVDLLATDKPLPRHNFDYPSDRYRRSALIKADLGRE